MNVSVRILFYLYVSGMYPYVYCMYRMYQLDLCLTDRFAVSLGCFHDDVRAEPGSWIVVGMIPIFNKRKATRGPLKRPALGPNSAARRRISLTHQCLGALLEGWNALTEKNKIIQWADGVWRRTRIILAGLFMDQPEADTYCCEGAQTCKVCKCPKERLHEPVDHPLKSAAQQEAKVLRVADGLNTTGTRLFRRNGSDWTATDQCTSAAYERERNALNGTHIMHNAMWGITGFDVQQCVSERCICLYHVCINMNLYVLCEYYCCIGLYLVVSVYIPFYIDSV